jgi:hypothetical protein
LRKHHLGPQNGPGSETLLKIVNCQNGQKTVLSDLEKVGGHRYPPGSKFDQKLRITQNIGYFIVKSTLQAYEKMIFIL